MRVFRAGELKNGNVKGFNQVESDSSSSVTVAASSHAEVSKRPSTFLAYDSSNDGFDAAPSHPLEPVQAAALSDDDIDRLLVGFRARAVAELDRFLGDWTIPITTEPLQWWRDTGRTDVQYPILAHAARYFFSIIATSAAMERGFKAAKYVSREERGAIGDHTLDVLAVLAYHFKKFPDSYKLLFSE